MNFCLALLYGCTSTAIEKARGVEDEYNSLAAGVTTGVLFKSTGNLLDYRTLFFLFVRKFMSVVQLQEIDNKNVYVY